MGLKLKKNLNNIRYVGQRDSFSCGPLSILNILKWAGYDITSKYLPILKKHCKTDMGGTNTEIISKVLSKYSQIKFECIPFIKIQDLHNHIKNDGSAIIEVSWFDEKKQTIEGHFYNIIDILSYNDVTLYKTINWGKSCTEKYVDRKKIVTEFRKCARSQDNPKAWLIRRKIGQLLEKG
jgi:hypothetical protein